MEAIISLFVLVDAVVAALHLVADFVVFSEICMSGEFIPELSCRKRTLFIFWYPDMFGKQLSAVCVFLWMETEISLASLSLVAAVLRSSSIAVMIDRLLVVTARARQCSAAASLPCGTAGRQLLGPPDRAVD